MAWDYLLSINFIPAIIIVGLFLTQLTQLRSVDKDINEFLSLQICWNLPYYYYVFHTFFSGHFFSYPYAQASQNQVRLGAEDIKTRKMR